MMAERLAELRRDLCTEAYTSYLPKTVRELLDHIDGLKFANCVLDDAAKDAQAWSVRAQTAEAKCAQLEAQADESSATMERLSGVVERYRGGMQPSSAERCALRWSHSSATDRGSFERGWEAREAEGLEAQRGELARELDLTKREAWTAKERHKDERDRADGLRERLDELSADEFVKAQRGGAVVVPDDAMAWMYAHGNDGSVLVCGEKASGEEFKAKFRAIPTGRVLADGMVGVDREELMYLHAFEKYARKHGPESIQDVAGTLDHLRCAQQAKGE